MWSRQLKVRTLATLQESGLVGVEFGVCLFSSCDRWCECERGRLLLDSRSQHDPQRISSVDKGCKVWSIWMLQRGKHWEAGERASVEQRPRTNLCSLKQRDATQNVVSLCCVHTLGLTPCNWTDWETSAGLNRASVTQHHSSDTSAAIEVLSSLANPEKGLWLRGL